MNREAVFGRKKRLVVCFCFFRRKNSFKKTQFPLLQGQFDQSLQEMGDGWKRLSWFSSLWFQPIWKKYESNWIISPSRGENKKYWQPPARLSWFCLEVWLHGAWCIPTLSQKTLNESKCWGEISHHIVGYMICSFGASRKKPHNPSSSRASRWRKFFKRKKNYIAKKEFAYRMCARWPTITMSKLFSWVWTKLLPLHGCDVMCFGVMCLWFDLLSSDVTSCEVICGTTPVLLCTTQNYNVTTPTYYSLLQSITPVLLCTFDLLQRTTPVLLCTTKYYSRTTPVLQRTTPVLICTTKYYSGTTKYYSSTTPVLQRITLLQQCTTPVLQKVLRQYYSVLQSTTPVLLCTTKYYASTTMYYAGTTTYYSSTTPVLQSTTASTTLYYTSTTPVLLCTTKYYTSTTLYYKVLLQYYSVLQSTTPVLLCTTPVLQRIAPVLLWNVIYNARQQVRVTVQLHQILRLPRKMNGINDLHHICNIISNACSQFIKVTPQPHQILHLPRKMTMVIDDLRHIWNVISNARSQVKSPCNLTKYCTCHAK